MGPDVNTAIQRARVAKRQPRAIVPPPSLSLETGDVVVTLEIAGIWRSGPGLTAPTTQTVSEYRVSIHGQTDTDDRLFEMYDRAMADGHALAADRKARLFYVEGEALTLVKDYRSGALA
jgi:hypothetical protein